MGRSGVVSIDIEPNLPALGSRIEGFARNLKPLSLNVEMNGHPKFQPMMAEAQRRLDSLSTTKAQTELRHLGDTAQREMARVGQASGSVFDGTSTLPSRVRLISAESPGDPCACSRRCDRHVVDRQVGGGVREGRRAPFAAVAWLTEHPDRRGGVGDRSSTVDWRVGRTGVGPERRRRRWVRRGRCDRGGGPRLLLRVERTQATERRGHRGTDADSGEDRRRV